jgi:hypothetical protein
VKWWSKILYKQTAKKAVPISTWSPWNPVATKKVLPYTESAIVNGASMYSIACSAVNTTPKAIVSIKPIMVLLLSPLIMAWCDQVTDAPLDKRMAVFNSGTSNGFSALIPIGGQTAPISTVGPNEE